jgi:hypothetical protein
MIRWLHLFSWTECMRTREVSPSVRPNCRRWEVDGRWAAHFLSLLNVNEYKCRYVVDRCQEIITSATPIINWCIIWVLTKSGTYESWCGTTPVRVDPNWPSVTWCGTTALHNNRMSICSTGSDMAYCRSWLMVYVPSYMFGLFTCSLFSGHCINAVNI